MMIYGHSGMYFKFGILYFRHKIYYGVLVLLLNYSLSHRENLTQTSQGTLYMSI